MLSTLTRLRRLSPLTEPLVEDLASCVLKKYHFKSVSVREVWVWNEQSHRWEPNGSGIIARAIIDLLGPDWNSRTAGAIRSHILSMTSTDVKMTSYSPPPEVSS
jgi:hypothetical protein